VKDDGPRFDRSVALGWCDVALDGLSCYLRCVEALLLWMGHTSDAVAVALAGPVDLLRRASCGSQFDSHAVRWAIAEDGSDHWERLAQTLSRGTPAMLMPDRFYWPADEYEGRRHFHDHVVLAVALEGNLLHVLDTDGSPREDYIRAIAVTPAVQRACTRWGVLRPTSGRPPATLCEYSARTLTQSLALLELDTVELRSFGAHWRTSGLDEQSAHALHVAVLGDFQPALFLFAEAAERFDGASSLAGVTGAARSAARRAKSLGLLLLALHRKRSTDAYALALDAFDAFAASAETLRDALALQTGAPQAPPPPPTGAFELRLTELARYCFDSSEG
jgi:hypothetical protein